MKNLIEKLQDVLLEENETVTFMNEDSNYFYFTVNNEDVEDFNGITRVGKDSSNNEYHVEFKQENENVYRGNGTLEI